MVVAVLPSAYNAEGFFRTELNIRNDVIDNY
jgi:hypothetical protein